MKVLGKIFKSTAIGLIFSGLCVSIQAQNTRKSNENAIGWYNYQGTFALNPKWSLHTEYQWRRTNWISDWQQSLLRLGINFQLHSKLQVRLGYAWIETFAYGDIPINSMGKEFTEHRIFQMCSITDKVGIVELSHRFMLEQRWVGRYSTPNLEKEDIFSFMNRIRYMFRMQIPLKGTSIVEKTPYVAFYDEIFVGFGKNVNENIFDQNRIGMLFGYKFNKNFRLEFGYLNQILQLGRRFNNQVVVQYNQGLIVNSIFNFNIKKPKQN